MASTIYAFCLATWWDLWKSDLARERWIDYLYHNHRYRSIMGGILDWIDARLTPEIAADGWQPTEARAAWSHNLLGLLLVMALAYPMLSLFGIWVYGGEAGRIGSFPVLPAEPDWMPRYGALGLILASGLLMFLGLDDSKSRWRPALFIPAIGILISVLPRVLPEDAGAVAVAFAGAFAVAGAVAFAGAVAGAVAVAFAGAVAVAFAGAFAGAGAFAVAVAFAVAFAVAGAVMWLGRRTGKPMPFLLAWAIFGLTAILIAVTFGVPRVDRIEDDSSIILFIGILPLLNALADFASTGLTRYYLRQGLAGSPWLAGLKDFIGGALIFTLLVTAMMGIAALTHWPDGTPLLDLGNLLTDIRAHPGDYWWLYLTFLTTLLPTVLHLGIALFATVVEMWPGLRAFIVDGLTEGGKGDDPKGRWALRALCLTMTVAIMLPIMVFGWVVQYHGIVGGLMLDMFTGIACVTGMLTEAQCLNF
ncbi:MAG: hypothetical protein AB8B85_18895 [Paracoccaceae bacterium]